MYPYLLRIPLPWGGSIKVASYGFMIMCGFLTSLWVAYRRAKAAGLNPTALFDCAVAALLGGIVGARVFFVVHEWDYFSGRPWEIVRIDKGGLWFYGGLTGATLVALLAFHRKNLPLRRTLDLVASVLPLGHAFGRLGCFLNGCCFGKVTDSVVGVRFPRVLAQSKGASSVLAEAGTKIDGSPVFLHQLSSGQIAATADVSLPVHPTQLYAVAYNLFIFVVLSLLLRRRWRDGEVAWVYAILYGSARFTNEIYRADQPAVGLGLTLNQWLCIGLVLFGFVMFLLGRSRPYEPFPALADTHRRQSG